jgi:hypothetical protein
MENDEPQGAAGPQCLLCSLDRIGHQMGEERGEINHKFSLDGGMQRSTMRVGSKVGRPKPTVMITVVPAPDLALRKLLVAKGLIDESELIDAAPQISAEDLGLQ